MDRLTKDGDEDNEKRRGCVGHCDCLWSLRSMDESDKGSSIAGIVDGQ